MLILAQADWVAPSGFAAWIACAAFALMLVNQVAKLGRSIRGEPAHPPAGELDVRVKIVEGGLVRNENEIRLVASDMKQLRQDIVSNGDIRKKDIEAKVESTRRELKQDITELRESLQEQHNSVLEAVAELKGRMQ